MLLLLVATIFFLALLLKIHVLLITCPVPINGFEGTMLVITQSIANGVNPYTASNLPIHMDVYPPFYNMIMAPIALFLGNTLQVHRLISGLFMGLACWLCYYAMRKENIPRVYAGAGAVLMYGALLYYEAPIASTNTLGLAIFLATVILPWANNFSRRSLLLSILLGLLSFYTKQYFVIGPVYISAYLFITQSKIRGLKYAGTFLACLVISLIAVRFIAPFYINNTIFIPRNIADASYSMHHSLDQAAQFAKLFSGVLGMVFIYCIVWLFTRFRRRPTLNRIRGHIAPSLNLHNVHSPLIKKRINYFAFCFTASTLIVLFYLGTNTGTFMTYLFQLMLPFLLMASFGCFKKQHTFPLVIFPLLVIWSFYRVYGFIPKDFSVDNVPWHQVNHLIANHDKIYAVNFLVPSLVKHNKKLYDDGQTIYFLLFSTRGVNFTSNLKLSRDRGYQAPIYRSSEITAATQQIWSNYANGMYSMLKEKKFDLLLLGKYPFGISLIAQTKGKSWKNLLHKNYTRVDSFRLSLTNRRGGGEWTVYAWKPKT